MTRMLLFLTFVLLAPSASARADNDGTRSAIVLVLDQGPRLAEIHPLVRSQLLDAIDGGDEADQLGIIVYGRSAKVLVRLQPLGDKHAFAPVATIGYARGGAMTEALSLAYAMLKASKVERRRVVLVTHSRGVLPPAVVKVGAKFRAAGIETAALGFHMATYDHLARFAEKEEEVYIALDSAAWPRFFRVAMGWIR
jgi:hypothetical protein